jgi:hypothetical protein
MGSSAYVNKKFKDLVLACVEKTELKLWKRMDNSHNELNFQSINKNYPSSFWVVSFDFRNDLFMTLAVSLPVAVSLVGRGGERVVLVKADLDSESVLDAIDTILSIKNRMIARGK